MIKRLNGADDETYITNWPLPFTAYDLENRPTNLRITTALGIALAIVSALYVVPHIKVHYSLYIIIWLIAFC